MKYFLLLMAIGGVAAAFLLYRAEHPPGVVAVRPVRGPAVEAVYATGTVQPSVTIPIAPRGSARLMALMADEGEVVKKDQVLAQMEDTDLGKVVEELKARAALAVKEYERQSAMFKEGAVPASAVDKAKADRDAARAAVQRAQAEAGFLKLLAPEDGLVIRRDGEVGEMIPAGQAVLWMSCCKPLRIEAAVDEEDIALVRPGQDVLIHADAFPGQVFKGTVDAITPRGDEVARSYRVRIALAGEEAPLMIGMTAETNIVIRESEAALLIPARAVQDGKVLTIQGGVYRYSPVATGARTAEVVEVTEGLGDDALIVPDPLPSMVEGAAAGEIRLESWFSGGNLKY